MTHGGTGGYKAPKPLPGPVEKLAKYCKENSVVLVDLFHTFDKEKHNHLSEEEFRNALKVSLEVVYMYMKVYIGGMHVFT